MRIVPESAGQVEPALPSIAQGRPELKSLAIDYRTFLFAKQPEPAMATTAAPVSSTNQATESLMPTPVRVAAVAEEQVPKDMLTRRAQPEISGGSRQQAMADNSLSQVAPAQDERSSETLRELQDARQAIARKDAKISALRRDLESMREQLETRDKELRAVKSSKQTQTKQDKRNRAELTVR